MPALIPTLTPIKGTRRALVTTDGVRVEAEHLPAVGRDAGARELVVVVAHGFTLHSRHPALRQVARWLQQGPGEPGVILLDLRGHGGSGGRSTLGDAEVHDVAAAVRWARTLGYRRVATLGFSLGAAVVLRHAALHSVPPDRPDAVEAVDAVVAVSGPGEWYFRGTSRMRWLHRGVERRAGRGVLRLGWRTRVSGRPWVAPYPLAPAEAVARIEVPLLLVHGSLDRYFPVAHAQALRAAAGEGAALWVEDGYGHAEAALSEELATRITGWLRTATATQPEGRAAWPS